MQGKRGVCLCYAFLRGYWYAALAIDKGQIVRFVVLTYVDLTVGIWLTSNQNTENSVLTLKQIKP
jgi:hypothetical protein